MLIGAHASAHLYVSIAFYKEQHKELEKLVRLGHTNVWKAFQFCEETGQRRGIVMLTHLTVFRSNFGQQPVYARIGFI